MDDDDVLDLSPDGKLLLVCHGNRPPRLVDTTTGKTTLVLKSGYGYASCGAFSPDGKWIATGTSRSVRSGLNPFPAPGRGEKNQISLFDAATGRMVAYLPDTDAANDYEKLAFDAKSEFIVAITRTDSAAEKERAGGSLTLWGKLPPANAEVAKPKP
jgi:WD40 repeat protein